MLQEFPSDYLKSASILFRKKGGFICVCVCACVALGFLCLPIIPYPCSNVLLFSFAYVSFSFLVGCFERCEALCKY